ncbi:Rho termination factor N-terminal domain-containing protein, partial [Streptomyces fuscigenes]|uniref:Rho termination factor N-terminal domain-containing protein n=1 Tax=Streptomyces fuscigenes TaxID=1528880 RepID=UPI0027E0EDDF
MSDTTDLMGVTADESVDTSAPAAGAASGTTSRRRRSGTGLDGMVLAELQQVASGLGIRGTARMRKSQLIEVIKEAQAGGGAPAARADEAAEAKPKRRATSRTRTGEPKGGSEGETSADATQQQIDIPGQPANDEPAAGERRRRRATAPAGAPEQGAEAKGEQQAEAQTSAPDADTRRE